MLKDWGATPDETARHYPALDLVPGATLVVHRAVDVDAPDDVTFRWLCQLRAGPYSYDLVDNLGRRSPRHLTPGLEHLELGQRFCNAFRLAAFEAGRSITITGLGSAITYEVGDGRLVGCLAARVPRGTRTALAAGDLLMMRKQLRTLSALAARTARQTG